MNVNLVHLIQIRLHTNRCGGPGGDGEVLCSEILFWDSSGISVPSSDGRFPRGRTEL